MNKDEIIGRYGEVEYERRLEHKRQWHRANPEKVDECRRQWKEANPAKVDESNHAHGRKGGKRYEKKLRYDHSGLRGERNKIRYSHGRRWRHYKRIIAPGSQIHHEWVPESSEYRGVALVEMDQHMHGFIDVIRILSGEITLLTEKDISIQPPGHKSQSSSPASG